MHPSAERLPKFASQQLFFSTSTREAFTSPSKKGWDLISNPSFECIMCPERGQKREAFHHRAPGWGRDSCEYSSSFPNVTAGMKEQVAANAFARERVKLSQEVRDVRGIGRLASAAETTMRSSFPRHPVQPPTLQLNNPRHARYSSSKPERSASTPHISGLVGNPSEWSPRTLRQIAICRTPGVRPSTETRRKHGTGHYNMAPMDTTTNHMVEYAAEQYKKTCP